MPFRTEVVGTEIMVERIDVTADDSDRRRVCAWTITPANSDSGPAPADSTARRGRVDRHLPTMGEGEDWRVVAARGSWPPHVNDGPLTLRLPRCLFLAFWAPQCAATCSNSRHVPASAKFLTPQEIGSFQQAAATGGNTRQNRLDPAVNRRVAGSSPANLNVWREWMCGLRSQSFQPVTAATYNPLTTCRIPAQTGANSGSFQQLAATRTRADCLFLAFSARRQRRSSPRSRCQSDELTSPGAEIRLPFSCLFGARDRPREHHSANAHDRSGYNWRTVTSRPSSRPRRVSWPLGRSSPRVAAHTIALVLHPSCVARHSHDPDTRHPRGPPRRRHGPGQCDCAHPERPRSDVKPEAS